MGPHRRAHQPLVGWLLGALLAFCAFLPVAAGPAGSAAAAAGAATLVRLSTQQHLEAVTAPQKPAASRSALHLAAATPASQSANIEIGSSTAVAGPLAAAHSIASTLSIARAPPSVRA